MQQRNCRKEAFIPTPEDPPKSEPLSSTTLSPLKHNFLPRIYFDQARWIRSCRWEHDCRHSSTASNPTAQRPEIQSNHRQAKHSHERQRLRHGQVSHLDSAYRLIPDLRYVLSHSMSLVTVLAFLSHAVLDDFSVSFCDSVVRSSLSPTEPNIPSTMLSFLWMSIISQFPGRQPCHTMRTQLFASTEP